jgi:hypothetical protein
MTKILIIILAGIVVSIAFTIPSSEQEIEDLGIIRDWHLDPNNYHLKIVFQSGRTLYCGVESEYQLVGEIVLGRYYNLYQCKNIFGVLLPSFRIHEGAPRIGRISG